MGMSGLSKSQVSRLCADIDDKVKAFLSRPIEGDWAYLWIDATYVKVRQNGRVLQLKAWNFAERAAELAAGARVDIAFHIEEDAWSAARGYPGWAATLRDFRAAIPATLLG